MERGKGIMLLGQSSTSQRKTPATSEADLSPIEPSTWQPEALLSPSESDDSEAGSTDSTDSSIVPSIDTRCSGWRRDDVGDHLSGDD